LIFGVGTALVLLWKVQRNVKNHVDLSELLIDADGRASWTKITAIGAFLFATWGFVVLVERDKMTEALFGLYIAVYSGAPVAYRFAAMRLPPQSQPSEPTS
jgi:hypothetical protein